MEDNARNASASPFDANYYSTLIAAGLPLIALMIVSAALYLAREVLIPLAAAFVLGVVLSPVASRLEGWVGRFLAAGLVVVGTVSQLSPD
jgi:predicted PurR-regulated permease PerM